MTTITLSSGVKLEVKPISGIVLQRAQMVVPDAEVPKFFIQDQNRWVDNPHHPDYEQALRDAALAKAEVALHTLVRKACKVVDGLPEDDRWLRLILRYEAEDTLLEKFNLAHPSDLRVFYILREAVRESEDIDKIVKASCLCEESVKEFLRSFGIFRQGVSIDEASLRHPLNTGIDSLPLAIGRHLLVSPADEYSACTGSGLDWWKWRSGQYSLSFMIETIASFRIRRLIETHAKDAEQTEQERRAKKK